MSGGVALRPGSRNFLSVVEGWLESVNRRPRLCLTMIAIVLLAQIRPWWLPEADGRSYLSMARSLATTGSMRNLGSAQLHFFPGYPLLVSPLFWFTERPLWLISAFGWLSAIGLMVGVYWWARSVVPQWSAWIAGLSVLNEGVWIHASRSLSEIPFMCGLMWSANAAVAAARSRSFSRAMCQGGLAAALLALTSLIRPAGLLLAVGFGLHLAWKAFARELPWRRAIALALLFGIPGSLGIAGFFKSELASAGALTVPTYLKHFEDKTASPLATSALGARLAIRDAGRVVVPGMFKAYQHDGWRDRNLLVYVPVCAVLAFGWWRLMLETRDPLFLMVPFYVSLYVLHSVDAGGRFFVPLMPIFMASVARLVVTVDRGRLLMMGGIVSAHFATCLVFWLAYELPRAQTMAAHMSELDQIARSIDHGRDCVAALRIKSDDVHILELALDRLVERYDAEAAQSDVQWIVGSRKGPVVPGFYASMETESFRLLRGDTLRLARGTR
jgi:hypothetical protein